MIDGGLWLKKSSTVGKAIRRDVDDAHQQRPSRQIKSACAQLPNGYPRSGPISAFDFQLPTLVHAMMVTQQWEVDERCALSRKRIERLFATDHGPLTTDYCHGFSIKPTICIASFCI